MRGDPGARVEELRKEVDRDALICPKHNQTVNLSILLRLVRLVGGGNTYGAIIRIMPGVG
jgi:hypothetical protein